MSEERNESMNRVNPLDWPQHAGQTEAVAREIAVFVRRRRRQRIGAAAACLAMILVGGVSWQQWSTRETHPVISTVVSLPPTQTLPDGSQMQLRAGADVAVEFAADATGPRRVVLRKGEAHFTVVKNPDRPFIVDTGGVAVRAVGTAFSVQQSDAKIEVVVTEGRVALDAPRRAGVALAFVDAGSHAVMAPTAPTPQVAPLSAGQLGEKLAWRVARLEFNGTPLREVVTLFNRHAALVPEGALTRLVVGDPALEDLPLSGMLRADNLPVLLKILESSYGIRAEPGADGVLVLRRG